jgi:hypothetical protein
LEAIMISGAALAGTAEAHGTLASCGSYNGGQTFCTSTGGIAGGTLAVLVLIYLAILVLFIIAYVKILTKAGYSGWWVLIGLVPLVGVVMFLVFAFSQWPVRRELEMLRAQQGFRGGYGPGSGYPGGPGAWGGGQGGGLQPYGSNPSPGGGFPPAGPGSQLAASGPPEQQQADAATSLPPFGGVPRDLPRHGSHPEAGGAEPTTSPSTATTPEPSVQAPAGWYPTPDGRRRYWDGSAWTEHFA